MKVIALGVTHKTAPVEVREQLAIGRDALGARLRRACEHARVAECVALSTCNRVELYAVVTAPAPIDFLKSIVGGADRVGGAGAGVHWLELEEPESVGHLFEVVSGLDAMVLGEQEIVAQVKRAFREAQLAGAVGPVLDELFRRALSVSKRVRTETNIGHGALSVASAAVRLARAIFGELGKTRVLIVGAGDTGELALRHLVKRGARSVVAVNRSFERAQALARRFDGRAARFDELLDELSGADIVITTTASPGPILTADAVRPVMGRRQNRPIFLVDIAVPRDIEPDVGRLDGVHLYNIDDLEAQVREHVATQALELERCRAIVDEETRGYEQWLHRRRIEPTLKRLYEQFETVRGRELDEHLGRLRGLTPELRDQVERFSEHLVKQLLHGPVSKLRGVTDPTALARHTEVLDELFGADGDGDVAEGDQEIAEGDEAVAEGEATEEEASRE